MNRHQIIAHYKKFHNLINIGEEHQIDVDWAEALLEDMKCNTLNGWVPVVRMLPKEYDKYFVCRKDGKVHWETWNGSGWAYNHESITHWMVIAPPPIKIL